MNSPDSKLLKQRVGASGPGDWRPGLVWPTESSRMEAQSRSCGRAEPARRWAPGCCETAARLLPGRGEVRGELRNFKPFQALTAGTRRVRVCGSHPGAASRRWPQPRRRENLAQHLRGTHRCAGEVGSPGAGDAGRGGWCVPRPDPGRGTGPGAHGTHARKGPESVASSFLTRAPWSGSPPSFAALSSDGDVNRAPSPHPATCSCPAWVTPERACGRRRPTLLLPASHPEQP